ISQLADDTTLFASSVHDIENALQIIEDYGNFSGLRLNKTKTEALGIYFGLNQRECASLNWDSKVDKCKEIVQGWSKRKLTFYGKIQIIKTLLIPKFTYALHALVVPNHVIKLLNKIIFSFLWDNKNEKIKRRTLIAAKMN
ncbi:LIN1-like protein, partial [Mya arenaria]